MEDPKELLKNLNNASISKIVNKEKLKKTDIEDAHNNEIIKQSENRTRLGQFAVNWAIGIVCFATFIIAVMICFYMWEVIQDPAKLESTLSIVLNQIKVFTVKHQAVIAVVATLMFGDKLKTAKKETK